MEELIEGLVGKQVDIAFGTSSIVRGTIKSLKDRVVYLEDEDGRAAYVALDKITVVWEVSELHSRPGFVV